PSTRRTCPVASARRSTAGLGWSPSSEWHAKMVDNAPLESRETPVELPPSQRTRAGFACRIHRRDDCEVQSLLPDVSPRDTQTAERRYDRRHLRTAGPRRAAHGRAHDADRPGRAVHGPQDFRPDRILRASRRVHAAFDKRDIPCGEIRNPAARFAARAYDAELRRRDEGNLRTLS